MWLPSAGRTVRQGAVLVLAATVVSPALILSSGLATAEPPKPASPLVMIDPAPTAIGAPAQPTKQGGPAASEPAQRGNPLWSLPLSSLSVTRERPIFSPSRRPPPPPVVAAPYVPPPSPLPPVGPPEPDHPLLTLLGALAGDGQGVGIFLNETDKTTLRLRIGEDHQGWVLTSIRGGAATFVKGERTATLTLLPIGSAAQTHASSIALGNTWRDGDGQMIRAPREPKPASPVATPLRNTWLDGDGQMVGAPPKNPLALPAVAPTSVDPAL